MILNQIDVIDKQEQDFIQLEEDLKLVEMNEKFLPSKCDEDIKWNQIFADMLLEKLSLKEIKEFFKDFSKSRKHIKMDDMLDTEV